MSTRYYISRICILAFAGIILARSAYDGGVPALIAIPFAMFLGFVIGELIRSWSEARALSTSGKEG